MNDPLARPEEFKMQTKNVCPNKSRILDLDDDNVFYYLLLNTVYVNRALNPWVSAVIINNWWHLNSVNWHVNLSIFLHFWSMYKVTSSCLRIHVILARMFGEPDMVVFPDDLAVYTALPTHSFEIKNRIHWWNVYTRISIHENWTWI